LHRRPRCWVVTDGRAGIEAQALGLAEAINRQTPIEIEVKQIALRAPWRFLPRRLIGDPFSKLDRAVAPLAPPSTDLWPDLWIGCGRASVPFTIAAKKQCASVFTVQVQNPRAPTELFDVVIPPIHDELSGDNVISILGAPNRIDGAWPVTRAPADGAQPVVAVLVGGSSAAFRFSRSDAARLAGALKAIADNGASLLITTSRRTPERAVRILRETLSGGAKTFWRAGIDPAAENPYPAMLAAADHVIVTEDSVNMASEAAMTGRPVHIFSLTRRIFGNSRKFDRFHAQLRDTGAARAFSGTLQDWRYPAIDETRRAAAEIIRRAM
jgi:mitochondrial fission protein ELM1